MKKVSMIFMIAVALIFLFTACPAPTNGGQPAEDCVNDTLTVVQDTMKIEVELKLEADTVRVETE